MNVSELIRFLQTITNQNKEIHIKETTITDDTYYSDSKPIIEIKEYDSKVVIR